MHWTESRPSMASHLLKMTFICNLKTTNHSEGTGHMACSNSPTLQSPPNTLSDRSRLEVAIERTVLADLSGGVNVNHALWSSLPPRVPLP